VQPPTLDGTTVKLTVADGGSLLLEALRALDAEGIAPTGVTLREPSLDDVFLSLTGHAAVEPSADGADPALRGAA
jgi:ABC-2 type transport system ATP-binding protein